MKLFKLFLTYAFLFFLCQKAFSAPGKWVDEVRDGRNFRYYIPANVRLFEKRPLLVALHGCLHSPEKFVELAKLEALAESKKIFMVLPEQKLLSNPTKCWNWFDKKHQNRGEGEPGEIMAGVAWARENYRIDSSRIYLAGVSAGGGMAGIILAQYPEVFAAGMVASGTMYKAAENMITGKLAASRGSSADPAKIALEGWNELKETVRMPSQLPVLVFHGDKDRACVAKNGQQAADQFMAFNDLFDDARDNRSINADPVFSTEHQVPDGYAYTRTAYGRSQTDILVEIYLIKGMGHGWSGGKPGASFNFPLGPDQTEIMWNFLSRYHK
ncbi:MAG: PHB depolymerase family esterase [Bdellovibrionota bacterium]